MRYRRRTAGVSLRRVCPLGDWELSADCDATAVRQPWIPQGFRIDLPIVDSDALLRDQEDLVIIEERGYRYGAIDAVCVALKAHLSRLAIRLRRSVMSSLSRTNDTCLPVTRLQGTKGTRLVLDLRLRTP